MPKVSCTEQQQQFVLANLSYSEDIWCSPASVDVSAQLQVGGRSALGRADRSHFCSHSGTPTCPYRFRIRGSCPIGVLKTKLYFVGPPEAMATCTRGKHCARTHTIDVYDTLIEPTRSPCFESRSHPLFESLGPHLRRLWWGWFERAAALSAARVSE